MLTPAELEAVLEDAGITLPPTQEELPYDDGEPMETQRHRCQMELLIQALIPWLEAREDGFVGGNMFVYYSMKQARNQDCNQDFKGPDVFVALDVPKGERKSWVCWEEEKSPDIVIELLSRKTANVDKGEKKQIYQNKMHVQEYFWYDPFNPSDWAGFQLEKGTYQPITLNEQNQLISAVMNLALVRWQGSFSGIETTWLRWANLDGTLLLTPTELEQQRADQEKQRADQAQQQADQEKQRADQAQQQAEQAKQRADRAESQVLQIARTLLQTGMDAAQISQITGLSIDRLNELG